MELETFRQLITQSGQRAIAAATELRPSDATYLACFEKLRKVHPAPLAKAALEIVLLRERAAAKFAAADRLYFTREALEQSSGDATAQCRARRFVEFGCVADLCSGVGGDTLALADSGLAVHAVELDPLRAAMAEANAAAAGVAERVTVHNADALAIPLPSGVRAAFADPGRRSVGKRHLNPEEYFPPVSAIRERFPADFPLGVKIAPGVAWEAVADLDAEAEFISVQGELKECVLWFGPLRGAKRRASVLPAGVSLEAETASSLPPVAEVGAFLFDPDPSVVRSGLTGGLCGQLGVSPIDYQVMLLTGQELVWSPFLTAYRVELAERFHLQRLREHLRRQRVGRVTMVKRGSLLDAEDLSKKLKLDGSGHRFVILTRTGGVQVMIVGERIEQGP